LNSLAPVVILHRETQTKKAMKTKTTKISNTLLLLGVIIACSTLTSCSSAKLFTGKMKYTYYKKVKANDSKGTFAVIQSPEQKKETNDKTEMVSFPVRSTVNAGLSENSALASNNFSISNSVKKVDHKEVKKSTTSETKINKVKKFYNEKMNRWFPSKSNTMEKKDASDNIIAKVLVALIIIALLYVLIVAAIYLLLQASGFTFAIGC
jgi:hypothetical protein